MGYAALTAFIAPVSRVVEDHRSHRQWVEAMFAVNWKGKGVPEEIKADLVELLDAAAERAAGAATRSGAAA